MPKNGVAYSKKNNELTIYNNNFSSKFKINDGVLIFQNNKCIGVINKNVIISILELFNKIIINFDEIDDNLMEIDSP